MAHRRARLALIPAAGRGTRFLPLTKSVPKELLPIVSTPALELVVAEASSNGVSDVLIVVSKGKTAIADYFAPDLDLESALQEKGDEAGLASIRRAAELATFHYVEQLEPRGLGDAVAHGEQFAAGEPLVVLLPDDLIDDRDELLGTMIDVQAERGGIVLGLIDVPRAEIRKYGCAVPAPGADPVGRRGGHRRSGREAGPGRGARAHSQSSAATCCRRRYSTRCARRSPAPVARSS